MPLCGGHAQDAGMDKDSQGDDYEENWEVPRLVSLLYSMTFLASGVYLNKAAPVVNQ